MGPRQPSEDRLRQHGNAGDMRTNGRCPSPHSGRGWPASAGRVRGRRLKRREYRGPYSFEILKDVMVPETNDAKALPLEGPRPPCVALGRMLPSVEFDDQTLCRAKKIGHITIDFDLTTKFTAGCLAAAQHVPQNAFCIGRIPPQLSRPAGQEMPPCHYSPSPRRSAPTLSREGERVVSELHQIHA